MASARPHMFSSLSIMSLVFRLPSFGLCVYHNVQNIETHGVIYEHTVCAENRQLNAQQIIQLLGKITALPNH